MRADQPTYFHDRLPTIATYNTLKSYPQTIHISIVSYYSFLNHPAIYLQASHIQIASRHFFSARFSLLIAHPFSYLFHFILLYLFTLSPVEYCFRSKWTIGNRRKCVLFYSRSARKSTSSLLFYRDIAPFPFCCFFISAYYCFSVITMLRV